MVIAEESAGYGADVVDEDAVEVEVIPQNLRNPIKRPFAVTGRRCISVEIQGCAPKGGPKEGNGNDADGYSRVCHQLVELPARRQSRSGSSQRRRLYASRCHPGR